ncbi:hypothetical protein KM043_018842, partial [Ampulex compressa]
MAMTGARRRVKITMNNTTENNKVYGAEEFGNLSTGPVSGGQAGPAGSSSNDREMFVPGGQDTTSRNTSGSHTNNPSRPKQRHPVASKWSRLENQEYRENIPNFL